MREYRDRQCVAGINRNRLLVSVTDEDIEAVISTNLYGTVCGSEKEDRENYYEIEEAVTYIIHVKREREIQKLDGDRQ
jgi:hypothetical protein